MEYRGEDVKGVGNPHLGANEVNSGVTQFPIDGLKPNYNYTVSISVQYSDSDEFIGKTSVSKLTKGTRVSLSLSD